MAKIIDINTRQEVNVEIILDPWEELEEDLNKAMDAEHTIPMFIKACKEKFKLEKHDNDKGEYTAG